MENKKNIDLSEGVGLENLSIIKEIKKATEDVEKERQKAEKETAALINSLNEQTKAHFATVAKIREEAQKAAIEAGKTTNPYLEAAKKEAADEAQLKELELSGYQETYSKKLAIDKWYVEESAKVKAMAGQIDPMKQAQLESALADQYSQKQLQTQEELWSERGQKIGGILSTQFSNILTDYDSFGDSMKKAGTSIANYLIQESMRAIMQQIFGMKMMQSMMGALGGIAGGGGVKGFGATLLSGIFKGIGIGKRHSGGVMPVGANTALPGTDEQLALLKGGERVLSPGENASYNSNAQGGGQPVVFNNFNVKAWDSKDVSKYLLENKQLLNSITFEGIKYNNGQLRTMVRNA